MSLNLPYPTQPAPNSALASAPVLANETALAQAIQAFDGSQINAGSVVASAFNASINPNTLLNDTIKPFVAANCIWSAVSSSPPVGTMTGGLIYVGPSGAIQRVVVNGIGSHTFAASSDTYVDIDYNGNVTYSVVSNNAASPSITANSVRVAIIITNTTAITFVNQGQLNSALTNFGPVVSSCSLTYNDSLGNLIYPTDPNHQTLGYRQLTTGFSTANTAATYITGLGCPVIIPTNRKAKITVYSSATTIGGAPKVATISLWNASSIGTLTNSVEGLNILTNQSSNGNGANLIAPYDGATGSTFFNPALTSDPGGSVTTTLAAGTGAPTYILVEEK